MRHAGLEAKLSAARGKASFFCCGGALIVSARHSDEKFCEFEVYRVAGHQTARFTGASSAACNSRS